MRRPHILFALAIFPAIASAAPDYCELSGLAIGAKKEFVGSIAAELANRQDVYGSPSCDAAVADGIKRGKRLLSGRRSSRENEDWTKLLAFESEVLNAVIANMQPEK
jgi:hypothetical protein